MMGFSVGALLVGIALLVLVILVIAMPILQRRDNGLDPKVNNESDQTTDPTIRRMQILLALRDLEFDYATGKVSEEDYHTLRAQLLQEAAALLDVDKVQPAPAPAAPATATNLDEFIEQAVQAKRRHRCPQCDHPVRPGDRFCAMCGHPLQRTTTCPECGAQVPEKARFCTACGQALTPVQEATL